MVNLILLLLILGIIAFLYSSVGHGGASGYLVVMALAGVSPLMMKPSALIMNLAVSAFSFIGFYRAGNFKFKLFLPFAIGSIPLAYVGGAMTLTDDIYKKVLAIAILFSVFRMVYQFKDHTEATRDINPIFGILTGCFIGIISGMIGIGGGIILSPVILLMRWGNIKETAAVSALFIFVNSLSGLYGQMQNGGIHLTDNLQYAVVATIIGGLFGSYYGSQKFNIPTLRFLLTVGLCIACLKLLLN
ncbi:MAG: sulfite exporter TauE/SafE family protein [Bacteroidetes bacterium]|nr:sulfite exporter TauE/SafE family protein [Bacteroidota bacterium]